MDRNARIPECPRCGNPIDIDTWMTSMDMETGAAALDTGKTVSLSGDCSACEAPLELFIERASATDKIGVDVWVKIDGTNRQFYPIYVFQRNGCARI